MDFSGIRKARKAANLTQNELADILGINRATVSKYESGQIEPTLGQLGKIAIALHTNVQTMMGYNWDGWSKIDSSGAFGDVTFQTEQSPSDDEIVIPSVEESKAIKKYRVLDEHGKEMVDVVLDKEYKRYQKIQETITISSSVPKAKENISSLQEQKVIYLPEPLQSASAGTGQFADDDTAEQVAVYYNKITSKADYIMRVSGDSMEPEFMNGDRVLVRSQPSVEIGEIGIFIVDGEQYVKIYRGSYLESLNSQYNDIEVSERSFCRGKVIGVLDPEWIAE